MYEDAGKRGVPLGGTFELSPLCNMNCKMCYIRISKEEMEKQGKLLTADEWLSLAKEAKSKGMLFLLLTGGEPFLYPDFWKLYESLKQMGFFVSINTNATLLEGETLERSDVNLVGHREVGNLLAVVVRVGESLVGIVVHHVRLGGLLKLIGIVHERSVGVEGDERG